jgi:hypothetical protein
MQQRWQEIMIKKPQIVYMIKKRISNFAQINPSVSMDLQQAVPPLRLQLVSCEEEFGEATCLQPHQSPRHPARPTAEIATRLAAQEEMSFIEATA